MHLIKILGHANSSLQNLTTIMLLIMQQGVQKSLCCCHILMYSYTTSVCSREVKNSNYLSVLSHLMAIFL